MTMISLLKGQHKEVKELFKTTLAEDPIDPEKAKLIGEKLLMHMELEEKFLYPEMKQINDTEEIATEAALEHQEAKKAIKDIMSGKLDPIELKVKVELLQLEIEHHVKEEEQEFFPQVKEELEESQLKSIEQEMIALTEKKEQKKPVSAAK